MEVAKEIYEYLKSRNSKKLREILTKQRLNNLHHIGEIVDDLENTLLMIASQ